MKPPLKAYDLTHTNRAEIYDADMQQVAIVRNVEWAQALCDAFNRQAEDATDGEPTD